MLAAEEFDYPLDEDRIAQHPIEPRDAARLLVDRGPGAPIGDFHVADLASLLQPGDLLVINETKVLPARLHLVKPTGGAVEVLLLEPTEDQRRWYALVRPGKRLRPGTQLLLPGGSAPVVRIDAVCDDGRRIVTVLDSEIMDRDGEMPLPPYITAPLTNPDRYQTVFARVPGSVAAPTAGLHFTPELFDTLAARGVSIARIELAVGLGTFKPMTTDVVEDHIMHYERYSVTPSVWEQIQQASRVVAVGTTVVRTLESVARTGQLRGSTNLFISRGFDWQIVDAMLTNFHVPRSTLLVLVDAFIGPRWRELYSHGAAQGYRFLSFGDAMLLERAPQ